MSKCKTYIINLIFRGYLVEDLHFGPFCHNWWIILIVLNEHDFIIEVGQLDSQFEPHPSYICKCDGVQSELCETPTAAISTVYQQIFKSKTKFSGPEIMGYDTPEIVQEYLNELPF
ncbi:8758_t:CDS:2 [Cetraspora pellucida]|uniref:8758_t:CDS:1 n=1 Tax=Cetraspora pellucida TaxID=1433469 RepID=A0ACA9L7Q5_9GLOM|nr:8758_t:CDS:2 [Cetraspora pellucida]